MQISYIAGTFRWCKFLYELSIKYLIFIQLNSDVEPIVPEVISQF